MKAIVNFLIGIIVIILVSILAYVFFVRSGDYLKVSQDNLTLDAQKVKNDAIDGCFKSATTTNSASGVTKIEPSMYLYDLCLKDKGFESTTPTNK